jgi:hypothetical protein
MFAFSELFQGQSNQENQNKLFNTPIKADILANIKTVKIKNNLGSFTLTKDKNTWFLIEPRLMPAKNETINEFIEALKSTKVNTTIEKDVISLNNYALENPSLSIDLFSGLEEQLKIQIGLINPLNNSSYITVSDTNKIYQMSGLNTKFLSYKLSDLIDSSVFSQNLESVTSLKLYNRNYKDPINELRKGKNNWISKKYKTITKRNVDNKLNELFDIKTYMIIDEENSDLRTLIDNYLDKPLYKVIIQAKGQRITYKVSSLIKSIPKLKLAKRQFFLMTASDRKFTYVIQKKFLDEFYIRYSDFK